MKKLIFTLLYKYMALRHTTILTQCKARGVLGDLFGTNQGNVSKMTFVAASLPPSPSGFYGPE